LKAEDDRYNALLVDKSSSFLNQLDEVLREKMSNFSFEACTSPENALTILKLKPFDVIIANDSTGLDFLEKVRSSGNATPFILLIKTKSRGIFSKAFHLGVDDIIEKGGDLGILGIELKNSVKKIIDFSNEVHKKITSVKKVEDAYTLQTQELEKRLWESNFLYSMPKILNYLEHPTEKPFLQIINLIRDTWKTTQKISIRIEYKGMEFKTDNFHVTNWKQASEIIVFGEKIGCVEVYFQESTPTIYETAFLIDALTREISKVTERNYKNTEIKKLSRAVEQSPSVIILTDKEGRIEWVNPKFVEVTGYTFNEIMGAKIPGMLDKTTFSSDKPYLRAIWESVIKGNSWKGEVLNKKKTGDFYWALTSVSPIRDEEEIITHFIIIQEDITQLKKALEALNKSEERNKAYVKAIPDLMLRIDQYGILLDSYIPDEFNFKFSVNEIKNKQILEVFPHNIAASFLKAVNMAFSQGESQPFEFSSLDNSDKKDSRFFEARVVSSGSSEALIIVRDITDKKQAEEASRLREARDKISVIIDTIADGILVLDSKGNQFLVNHAFKNLYHHIFKKTLPNDWNFLSNTKHIFHDTIKQLFSGKGVQTVAIEPVEGFHLQLISTKTQALGLEDFLIITMQDVTQFVKFDKIVKQFISTASHELRTPVSVIIQSLNNLEKYQEKMSDEIKAKLMDSLHRNANLMYELVENLLLISRIEEKRVQLIWEPIFPSQLLLQVLNQLEPKQKSKNITINTHMKEDIETYGDSSKIGQIFRILVDNAIKYSHDGGKIEINAFDEYQGLYNPEKISGTLFEFIDEGIGIKKSDQSLIFDRFFRSNEVKNLSGTGLGLSIARELIRLHGGEIYLESKYGNGSSFFVFLPRREKPNL
jgi:two-component system phosphate regulon sensor histidine kinase PhoR